MQRFSEEVCSRIYNALDIDPSSVHLALKPGREYCIYAVAKSVSGSQSLGRLVNSPAPIRTLEHFTCADKIILVRHDCEPITEYSIKADLPMESHLLDLLPVATAMRCGLFLIHYTGHYLAYFNADENGQLIQKYEQMIGQRAADQLPESMRTTVQNAHAEAIRTGKATEYFYTHPSSGRQRKAVIVPYPQYQQLAVFTMDATADVKVPVAV